MTRHCVRISIAAATAVVALAAGASSASAGILTATAPSCDDQPLTKPFLPWLDIADYTLLGGADFESEATGWTLGGSSSVASGNESYKVGSAGDTHSLSLPAGSSATSPAICVGIQHPSIRFFAKRRSGGMLSLSTLRVDVLVELATGDVISLPIGSVANGGSWQPTLPMLVVANLLPLLPGDTTPVAFRFTAQGADWSVDDIWVDPYMRH